MFDKHRELCCLLTSRSRVVQRVKVTLDRKFVANIGLWAPGTSRGDDKWAYKRGEAT